MLLHLSGAKEVPSQNVWGQEEWPLMTEVVPLIHLSSRGKIYTSSPLKAKTCSRNKRAPEAKFSSYLEAGNHQELKWVGKGPRKTGTCSDCVSSGKETSTHDPC